MHRVDGFTFEIGIFTNIEPDHIGPNEHASFEEYLSCKAMLFSKCRLGIVNVDDPHCQEILKHHTCRVETYGFSPEADIRLRMCGSSRDRAIWGWPIRSGTGQRSHRDRCAGQIFRLQFPDGYCHLPSFQRLSGGYAKSSKDGESQGADRDDQGVGRFYADDRLCPQRHEPGEPSDHPAGV